MNDLPITFASGAYDSIRPLLEGRIRIEGVRLTGIDVTPPAELFWRQLRHEEFDVAELSLLNFIMEIGHGIDRFVGLPVFPYRAFRQSAIWVRADSDLDRPEDLKGRRIGVPEYAMTMLLFVRGFLEDDHGIRPEDLTWVTVRPERVDQAMPAVPLEYSPGSTLEGLLADGRVDAIITTRIPTGSHGPAPKLRRLIPQVREVERAYYRRTRVFPIMHLVVIRRATYEANRWIAASLLSALERSKAEAYAALHEGHPWHPLPWLPLDVEEEWGLFGGDPYPYGLAANLPTLTAATEWAHRQGLAPRRIDVKELFAPEAIDAFTFAAQR
jgi:4,5-dihydroxyphthalate decarboxylase